MPLDGRTVVVGVSGGIACYKACELVRLLVGAGARVRVVMTAAAQRFVTPLTFQTLAGQPVATDTFDLTQESEIGHIRLADEANAVAIAPATANVIAKLAAGIADDLLTTVLLATRAPLVLAPAMNVHMWEHPTVQENVARLVARGARVVGPASGSLARRRRATGRRQAGAHATGGRADGAGDDGRGDGARRAGRRRDRDRRGDGRRGGRLPPAASFGAQAEEERATRGAGARAEPRHPAAACHAQGTAGPDRVRGRDRARRAGGAPEARREAARPDRRQRRHGARRGLRRRYQRRPPDRRRRRGAGAASPVQRRGRRPDPRLGRGAPLRGDTPSDVATCPLTARQATSART